MPRFADFPPLIIAMAISGLAMFVPATIALYSDSNTEARSFLYFGLIIILISVFGAIATRNRNKTRTLASNLGGIVLSFILLPAFLAAPMFELVPGMTILDAYVELVSCLTTTGFAVHAPVEDYSLPMQFWRAEVAWLGGLLVWITVITLLLPLGLGGTGTGSAHGWLPSGFRTSHGRATSLGSGILIVTPAYAGLTSILWLLLIIVDLPPFTAAMLAMSTISTSGIMPGGIEVTRSVSMTQELVVFVFLFLALSKIYLVGRRESPGIGSIARDMELRLALLLVSLACMLILIFNWQELVRGYNTDDLNLLARSIWGIVFTLVSFLSTSGVPSIDWPATEGLGFAEFTLVLLTIIGGGVATTAGGIKLLRVYLLFRSSSNAVNVMLYPSMVVSRGIRQDRSMPARSGEAWIFIILFLFTLAAVQLMLAATGLEFSTAFVLAVSSLSTTGPLLDTVLGSENALVAMSSATKSIVCLAMIIGRVELVVIIYLVGHFLLR